MTKVPWKTPSMALPRRPGLAWPLQSLPWLSPRSWRCPWAKNDPWSGHCENCPSFRSNKNDEQRLGSTENDVDILVSKWKFTLKRSLFFLIPPFKDGGEQNQHVKKNRVPGWRIIPHVKNGEFSGDPGHWKGGVPPTSSRPSSDRKTSWRDSTNRHRWISILWMYSVDFGISAMCFHDVSLWRSCRFQCILEKRCWKKCWPTCFFSLSVLLESELVCEVWEDYLNKLFFDVVSESNWELFRTASWNQDVGWQ